MLPPFAPAAPVETIVPVVLVILAPDKLMPPVCEERLFAPSSKEPAPELSASACMVIEPVPVVVMAALTAILLFACNTKLLFALPVAVATLNAVETVILFVACNVMVLPAAMPAKLPPAFTLNVLVKPASSANASVMSPGGVKPVVFASTVVNVIFNGSSSKLPAKPLIALKSALPIKSKYCLPDTSAKPPLPVSVPPLANMLP